jgi:hypothetical protein
MDSLRHVESILWNMGVAMPVSMSKIQIADQLGDRFWRLNNIYRCVDDDGRKRKFRMRPAQLRLWAEMHWRNIIVKARQLGFTTEIAIIGLDFVLFNRDKTAGFIAHNRESATNIYQKKILFPFDSLPSEIRDKKFNSKINQRQDAGGYINFLNGSSVRVGTSFRSDTCQFLHISEFAKICAAYPARAKEIITGSLPTVHRTGRVFFESTTEGAFGYFFDMAQKAHTKMLSGTDLTYLDYKLHFFPWHQDPKYEYTPEEAKLVLVTDKHNEYFNLLELQIGAKLNRGRRAWYVANKDTLGELMLQEMPGTFEEAFQTIIEGAYYKKQLDKARADGRIGNYPPIPGLKVHTFWDLGLNDCQAIWFMQEYAGQFRMINYYQADGEDLTHYCSVITDYLEEHGLEMGEHWGPHDIEQRIWTSAQSRIEVAYAEYGIQFYTTPNIAYADGVDAVRRVFSHCVFHEAGCDHGVKALTASQKEWDEKRGCYRNKALHNWASDGSDAFRYFAVVKGSIAETMSEEQPAAPLTPPSSQNIWSNIGV